MNYKRAAVTLIVAFVFIFGFEFVWHGVLMKAAYTETAVLWRADADFLDRFWLLLLGHAVVAFAFTGLYVSKIGLPKVATGMGYGILIGIFCAGGDLVRFAVQPLTTKILWMWMAGGLIEFAIVGALVGGIYNPQTPESPPQGSVAHKDKGWSMGSEG